MYWYTDQPHEVRRAYSTLYMQGHHGTFELPDPFRNQLELNLPVVWSD